MTKQQPNHSLSILNLKKGDSKIFKKIYSEYFESLCIYLLNYTQNRELIEDIVQDTFIKLWLNKEKLNINTSLKSYLYKSVFHNFIDNYRVKKKRDQFLDAYYQESLIKLVEMDTEEKEKRLFKLETCIQKLPDKCKNVFVHAKFQGMKHKEIAHLFDISIKTVEGHISKAYSLIKKCFS
ncbi:RNA polymerase sigma factor [Flavicella sediminum]|uniref:RNA polymerase sigma factor n=1 Tax=Flavicella sediminum TaxID=2585141 RepID=UPI0011243C2A|nr:sigma-70 family RNA polymerase sigma factor [Flavicella sediminum]